MDNIIASMLINQISAGRKTKTGMPTKAISRAKTHPERFELSWVQDVFSEHSESYINSLLNCW